KHVDIDGEIDRSVADAILYALDCRGHTNVVDVRAANDLEAELMIAHEVFLVIHRPSNADVHGLVLDEQALLESAAEHRAVSDRLAEVGIPGVEVRVKVQQGHGAVYLRGR